MRSSGRSSRSRAATGAIAYVAAYGLMFLWFYPILTGWHLSYTLWRYHMWMRSWI